MVVSLATKLRRMRRLIPAVKQTVGARGRSRLPGREDPCLDFGFARFSSRFSSHLLHPGGTISKTGSSDPNVGARTSECEDVSSPFQPTDVRHLHWQGTRK